MKEISKAAMARARSTVLSRFPTLVDSTFHYGAVDISPEHLVVWVLLKGPADTLPEWDFLDDATRPATPLDDGLVATLLEIREEIRTCFRDEGWPDADSVRVGFDSAERVARGGGWNYFK